MLYKIYEILQKWESKKGQLQINEILNDMENMISDENESDIKNAQTLKYNNDYFGKIKECYRFIEDYITEKDVKFLCGLAKVISKNRYWTYVLYDTDFRYKKVILEQNGENLYLKLVEFWSEFNDTFYDYGKAVEMLSKYYEESYWNTKKHNQEKITNAFFRNIKCCGDMNDYGFFYEGIKAISEHMPSLNDELIVSIIEKYSLNEIIIKDVYRHQILTLINCITEDSKLKQYFTNTILYGALAANILARLFISKDNNYDNNYYNIWYDDKYTIKNLKTNRDNSVFIDENRWYISNAKEKYIVEIKDCGNNKEKIILLKKLEEVKPDKEIPFKVKPYEWRLNSLINNKELLNEIKEWLYDEEGQMFSFSYLYIKNFREFSEQQISFTHEYVFDYLNKRIEKDNNEYMDVTGLYAKNIKSISCIVGKNGSGKTSIIEFLGKYFSQIIGIYDLGKKEISDILRDLKLPADMEFLAIFEYGKQHYYISNISGVNHSDLVKDYGNVRGLLSGNGEKNKVYFFSNKVDLWSDNNIHKNPKYAFSQIEYTRSDDIKEKVLLQKNNKRVNLMCCYVFTYIKYYLMKGQGDFSEFELEGIKLFNHLPLNVREKWEYIIQFSNYSRMCKDEEVRDFFFKEDNEYFQLSSGQEAKLIFLAKLYWCVEGYKKFLQEYGDYLKEAKEQIDESRCIQKEEAAIIYIDEGDVYYHPEWQRQFVKSVCEILNEREDECQLQVIIATNSPYILSDFLNQDVIYVLNNEEASPKVETFGQNIHTLLSSPFFMCSTLGQIAYETIIDLIKFLNEKIEIEMPDKIFEDKIKEIFHIKNNSVDIYDFLVRFSDSIGEEIYRIQIKQLISEAYADKVIDEEDPDVIKKKIESLQKKLEIIERKN